MKEPDTEDQEQEEDEVDVPSFRPVRFPQAVRDLLAVKPDPEDKPKQTDYPGKKRKD